MSEHLACAHSRFIDTEAGGVLSLSCASCGMDSHDVQRQRQGAVSGGPLDHLCAWMGCRHAEAWHGENGCIVPVSDWTIRYNAAGEKLPPCERPCGCTWVEPVVITPRPIKDRPQA